MGRTCAEERSAPAICPADFTSINMQGDHKLRSEKSQEISLNDNNSWHKRNSRWPQPDAQPSVTCRGSREETFAES